MLIVMSNDAVGHDKGKQVLFAKTNQKPGAQKEGYMTGFNAYVTTPVDIVYRTKEEVLNALDASAKLLDFKNPQKETFLYNTEFFDTMQHGEVLKNMRDYIEKNNSNIDSQKFLEDFMHAISQTALKMELLRYKIEKSLVIQNPLYNIENIDIFFENARNEEFSLTFDRKAKELHIERQINLLCDRFPQLPEAIKEAIYLTFQHIQGIDFGISGMIQINQN